MATYLLTWNPSKWHWEDLAEESDCVKNGENKKGRWSCGNTKKVIKGDRFFLFKQGKESPKGIFASGYITKSSYTYLHWNPQKARKGITTLYVGIKFDILLNPYVDPILERDFLLKDKTFSKVYWNTQSSGIEIKPEIAEELEIIWKEFSNQNDFFIPEEIEESESHNIFEGAKKTIQVNSYERNPVARRICIDTYGSKCSVCDFDFNRFYGEEVAESYVHVHHLKQLSEIAKEYEVNPIEDLRPVCPNCHAIIHRRNPPYSIEEVRQFIKTQQIA
jgi:5-methylcytosine-specific restriction enzyme A